MSRCSRKRSVGWYVLAFIIVIAPLLLLTNLSQYIPSELSLSDEEGLVSKGNSDDVVVGASIKHEGLEPEYIKLSYNNAVKEIHQRIEHEHILFVLKFTLVGAVLSVLFKNSIYGSARLVEKNDDAVRLQPAIVCWAAIAISAVVDVRMQVNLAVIRDLGIWVNSLEDAILVSGVKGWETYFRESPLLTNAYSPLMLTDRQLLTWLLYVVTVYWFVLKPEQPDKANLFPFLLCLLLFGFVGLHFYYRIPNGFVFYIPSFVAVTVISCLACYFLLNARERSGN